MDKKRKIGGTMFCVEIVWKRRLHPVWTKMGLTAGQPRILFQLSQKDRTTRKELSDTCCIEPATLSRALDKLETMGYIARNDNPDCWHLFLIEVTGEGKSMAEQTCQTFTEVEERMTEGFSVEEVDLMGNMLGRVYEDLR